MLLFPTRVTFFTVNVQNYIFYLQLILFLFELLFSYAIGSLIFITAAGDSFNTPFL